MKERPILFSAPMVCAILDGSKTQTRRVVKAKYLPFIENLLGGLLDGKWNQRPLPYGKPGDRLWVREAWSFVFLGGHSGDGEVYQEFEVQYRAGGQSMTIERGHHDARLVRLFDTQRGSWRPSIHMPRWASRILLEIVSVRVERLNECSESDAQAEGIKPALGGWWSGAEGQSGKTPQAAYALLWNGINGAGSWDANPWVWVVEFKKVNQ